VRAQRTAAEAVSLFFRQSCVSNPGTYLAEGGREVKTLTLTLLLVLLIPAVSLAGIVKGTLWYNDRQMGEGIRIEIRHGSKVYSTVTDEHGRFRLIVGEVGSCRLIVVGNSQTPEMRIISRKSTVEYNIELYRLQGGGYGIREKE
jgi:hypothetical protein